MNETEQAKKGEGCSIERSGRAWEWVLANAAAIRAGNFTLAAMRRAIESDYKIKLSPSTLRRVLWLAIQYTPPPRVPKPKPKQAAGEFEFVELTDVQRALHELAEKVGAVDVAQNTIAMDLSKRLRNLEKRVEHLDLRVGECTTTTDNGIVSLGRKLEQFGAAERNRERYMAEVSAGLAEVVKALASDDDHGHRCADPACPGLPYRASDRPHPCGQNPSPRGVDATIGAEHRPIPGIDTTTGSEHEGAA